ncbi:MAG: NAD-dependent epimerase/dehydratase family protein [Acidobacteriia bacterium]|nr:NAD-dependent epimerase/dehydratase family protein [Terriglobia bacterium]
MIKKTWFSNLFDVAVRVLADLVTVHVAMLFALLFEALKLKAVPTQSVSTYLTSLRSYYVNVFLPLSTLFPCACAISGLYTRTWRGTAMFLKLRRAAVTAVVSVLGLVIISAVLYPSDALPPYSTAAAFAILVVIATPGVRWLKYWAFESERAHRYPTEPPVPETILVVGGAGYIGSIVTRKLLDRGYRVRVLDSLVYGASPIEEIVRHPRFKFLRGDCRNIQDVVRAMTGVRAIVHLAAIVGDPACDRDHKTAREINYAATRMMIEIAKGEGVRRFVFASSCSVYGASDELMTEDSEVSPVSLYAKTKVDSEKELLTAMGDGFHPTILRFSTIFGLSPRPRFDLVVNLLTAKAMKDGVVTIFNGEQWRPFLHVGDAAESIIRVLEAPVEVVGGQTYNVGDDGLNYTLGDLARRINDVFPDTRIEHVHNSDRRNYRVSFRKIKTELGFFCSKTLEDGIKELKVAFENGLIMDYHLPLYSNVKFLQQYGSPLQQDEVGAQVMAALAQRAEVPELVKVFSAEAGD